MKRALVLALVAGAVAASQVHAGGVPPTVGFSARLVDDKTGDPLTGAHHLHFVLYDAKTGGNSPWAEDQDVTLDDGLLFVSLGQTKALDATVFTGSVLFLEVSLDNTVMDPRIEIDSVPYAARAGVASDSDAVGGVMPGDLQHRVTGTCGSGSVMTAVNVDGSVTCTLVGTGNGTITSVTGFDGVEAATGSAGDVKVGLTTTCNPGELLKWNGTAWFCGTDLNSGGDITSVNTSPASGLVGGVTSGDATLSLTTTCAVSQLLKWNGAAWVCAIDLDTNSGGTITAVNTGPSSGLVGGATTGAANISLITSCSVGQMLKWNGTAWGCANDTDTNSGGTVQNVIAGNGLTGGGGTANVTLDVVGGTGITVAANNLQLDTAFTDTRYVNATGDTMTGALDMSQQRVLNRACPPLHVRIGPGLCTEDVDAVGFTFAACATRCRTQGTHVCRSSEMRAVLASGVALSASTLLDWVDDQDAVNSALFVNSTNAETMEGARATNTSSFCRCCADVE